MVRRFNPSIRPVQSLKHIVDVATSTVLAVQSVVPIIEANVSPALGSPTQVNEGSTVNSIYLRVEVLATNVFAGVPRIYMAVFKHVANSGGVPNANGTGISAIKKRIIHQEMIMIGGNEASAFPRTLFVGVIKIPKSLRRIGYLDRFEVLLQNGSGETTGITNACVQAIYKEYQ